MPQLVNRSKKWSMGCLALGYDVHMRALKMFGKHVLLE